jgi:transcriptional regulator with XRE-family HTH domain
MREVVIPKNGNGDGLPSPSASAIVRSAIISCGMSRGELSRRTGVNAATISRFMNGRSTITLTTFEQLSRELGLFVGMRRDD